MKSKSQLFSGEFLVSYLIFTTALVIVLYMWDSNLSEINAAERQQDMSDLGVKATEQLLRTPGSPRNWTADNFTVLGLANESRVLQRDKIAGFVFIMSATNNSLCLNATNYECNRYLLGLGRYDFAFNLTYMNDTTVRINNTLSFAGKYAVNETRRITVVRTAILDDNLVKLYFTVWSK